MRKVRLSRPMEAFASQQGGRGFHSGPGPFLSWSPNVLPEPVQGSPRGSPGAPHSPHSAAGSGFGRWVGEAKPDKRMRFEFRGRTRDVAQRAESSSLLAGRVRPDSSGQNSVMRRFLRDIVGSHLEMAPARGKRQVTQLCVAHAGNPPVLMRRPSIFNLETVPSVNGRRGSFTPPPHPHPQCQPARFRQRVVGNNEPRAVRSAPAFAAIARQTCARR